MCLTRLEARPLPPSSMNDLANRRFTEQLNKEKDQRRAWAAHKKQQQIFEVRGGVIFAAI